MSSLLTSKDIEPLKREVAELMRAAVANPLQLEIEDVEARTPMTLRQHYGLRKVPPLFPVSGIRFAKGEHEMEGILFEHNHAVVVAAKVNRHRKPSYERYELREYIEWVILEMPVQEAHETLVKLRDFIVLLLPKGNPVQSLDDRRSHTEVTQPST